MEPNALNLNTNPYLPFGEYKGFRIEEVDLDYLYWVSNFFWDTDFHYFAWCAKNILARDKHIPYQDTTEWIEGLQE